MYVANSGWERKGWSLCLIAHMIIAIVKTLYQQRSHCILYFIYGSHSQLRKAIKNSKISSKHFTNLLNSLKFEDLFVMLKDLSVTFPCLPLLNPLPELHNRN